MVALVMGASSGIGLATAELLALAGAAVSIADIEQRKGELAAESILRQGGQARFFLCDVRRSDEVKRAVEQTVRAFAKPTYQ
jgi:NAD(P)-dependent dehydrogenase (short-subunit alcohol dehydrogenase family)